MNLEAVKISRCPLPAERSWTRGWTETGRWSPLADQCGCVWLYTTPTVHSIMHHPSLFEDLNPRPRMTSPRERTLPCNCSHPFDAGHLPLTVSPPSAYGIAGAYYCHRFDLQRVERARVRSESGVLSWFQRKAGWYSLPRIKFYRCTIYVKLTFDIF